MGTGLYGVADDAQWEAPELVVDARAFPNELATGGFLTPTPVLREPGTVRIFGGMRDPTGVSRIGWVDIDAATRSVVAICDRPALDVGPSGAFDANGVILGDVSTEPLTGDLLMAYVGFSAFPTVKFRAYSGLAMSSDGGETFTRVMHEPWLGTALVGRPNSIIAAHALRCGPDGVWSVLVAVGDGWERIGGTAYPRYFTVAAEGSDLASLTMGTVPLLPMPDGVYRLGRPRFAPVGADGVAIVATGGRRDGDYRPYAFLRDGGSWAPMRRGLPVEPGCSPLAQIQAAYPTHLHVGREAWVMFNGDDMGCAGALLTRAPLA